MRNIVLVLLLAAAVYIVTRSKPPSDVITLASPATERQQPSNVRGTAPRPAEESSRTFECDGRTRCTQMRSCAEAKYFLAHCPNTKMDGDEDGVPCELQWCG